MLQTTDRATYFGTEIVNVLVPLKIFTDLNKLQDILCYSLF